ncbi:MAG TPA: MarR family transcriptional regulator [Dehalococcoidia bacterium]|nr:MarR family transcriptional regulator [Dehalococcoidia bacterium]
MPAYPDLSATRGCYCLAARRYARAITRFYESRLRPYGLRATQFSILAALTLKGPTRIGELADLLGVERTTLSRSVALLVRNGWITVARSRDARERLLRITDAGRARLEEAFPAWEEAQQQVKLRRWEPPRRATEPEAWLGPSEPGGDSEQEEP